MAALGPPRIRPLIQTPRIVARYGRESSTSWGTLAPKSSCRRIPATPTRLKNSAAKAAPIGWAAPKMTAAKLMKPRPAVMFCAKMCRPPAASSAPPTAQRTPPSASATSRARAGLAPTLRAARGCSPAAAKRRPKRLRRSSTHMPKTTQGMAGTKTESVP